MTIKKKIRFGDFSIILSPANPPTPRRNFNGTSRERRCSEMAREEVPDRLLRMPKPPATEKKK
jgi:hypothetical protein